MPPAIPAPQLYQQFIKNELYQFRLYQRFDLFRLVQLLLVQLPSQYSYFQYSYSSIAPRETPKIQQKLVQVGNNAGIAETGIAVVSHIFDKNWCSIEPTLPNFATFPKNPRKTGIVANLHCQMNWLYQYNYEPTLPNESKVTKAKTHTKPTPQNGET